MTPAEALSSTPAGPSRPRQLFRFIWVAAVAALLSTACASSDTPDESAGTLPATESGDATTLADASNETADPDASTGSESDSATADDASGDTSDGASAGPGVHPLTGVTTERVQDRPAIVVKIDNHDRARPQFGLLQADVVFEEIVEGGLTRFAAVFQSQGADVVGPVRSVRTSDFPLLENLGTPLFANSGGNTAVLNLLTEVDAVDVSSNAVAEIYSRLDGRQAPHNLVTDTASLWAAGSERGASGRPSELFLHDAEAGGAAGARGDAAVGVELDFGDTMVEYRWDAAAEGWARSQNGTPHVDADDQLVAPTNVVVQFVSYGRSSADGRSPEAVLIGEGAAWVFTDGRVIVGTWERDSSTEATRYLDEAGELIALEPGSTWVALPRVGQAQLL